MKISLEASKGFVVVNYPKTYNQAKLLESKLSGYISETESPELKSSKLKEVFNIVLDKSEKINPPFQLLKGGFDFIFYLNVPGNECIRRAVGRLISFEIIDGNRERNYVTQDILSYVNQLVELNEQHDREVFENQDEEELEDEEENPDGNILDDIDDNLKKRKKKKKRK